MMRVVIYEADGARIAGACRGPGWLRSCPRAPLGGRVMCAGRQIRVIDEMGKVKVDLSVEPDATSCPLATLHAGGQRPS